MAHLTKRKASGCWYIRWREKGKYHWLSTGEKLKANAELIYDEWKSEHLGFSFRVYTLYDLRTKVLQFGSINVAKSTLTLWLDTIDRFCRIIKDKPLKLVNTNDIESYKHVRIKEVKKVSCNIEIRVLKRFFNLAVEFNMLRVHRIKFKQFNIPKSKPLAFSQLEKQAIVNAIKNRNLRDIVVFAFNTGCRLGEILNLEVADCEFKSREVTILTKPNYRTKTGNIRAVPMNDALYNILKSRLETNVIPLYDTRYVFSHDGMRFTVGYISRSFKRVLRKLKFDERYKFHCTRHTFATELADRNVPQHIIQDLLGHADMKSTAVYLHVNRDEKFSAVCKL